MCGICGNTFSDLGQLKDHRTLDHKIAKTKSSNKTGKRRVSIQGVRSHGGHFACLCRGVEFYEVKKKS